MSKAKLLDLKRSSYSILSAISFILNTHTDIQKHIYVKINEQEITHFLF